VRKVGSDTGSVNNIIQGELIDQRASLQEERERLLETVSRSLERGKDYVETADLANATRGTENNLNLLAG
jgi:hypothetical protein